MEPDTEVQQQLPIMVVEDSPIQLELCRRILVESGYRVITARDGVAALEQLSQELPALILSDITMPRMDGIELCRRVRSNAQFDSVRMVLVTMLDDPRSIIDAAQARCDGYLLKPYEADSMLEKIGSILCRRTPVQEEPSVEARLHFSGEEHRIQAPPSRLAELMLSSYESAISHNHSLALAKLSLEATNRAQSEQLAQLRQSQQATEVCERRFRAVVSMVSDIIYCLDTDGCFLFVNETVAILGWQPSELIGQHFSVLLDAAEPAARGREVLLGPAAQRGVMPPKLFDERRSGERATFGLEVRLRSRDGNEGVGLLMPLAGEVNSAGFYADSEGAQVFLGTVGAIRDITRVRALEAENLALRDQLGRSKVK